MKTTSSLNLQQISVIHFRYLTISSLSDAILVLMISWKTMALSACVASCSCTLLASMDITTIHVSKCPRERLQSGWGVASRHKTADNGLTEITLHPSQNISKDYRPQRWLSLTKTIQSTDHLWFYQKTRFQLLRDTWVSAIGLIGLRVEHKKKEIVSTFCGKSGIRDSSWINAKRAAETNFSITAFHHVFLLVHLSILIMRRNVRRRNEVLVTIGDPQISRAQG